MGARFLELYGSTDPADRANTTWTIERIDRFFRDAFFLCPAREVSASGSSHGQSVYEYVFAFNMHTNFTLPIKALTATHAFELPFVFRNWLGLGNLFGGHGQEWHAMSDVMSCTWASFVRCQKPKCPSDPPPNCAGVLEHLPTWPAYSPTKREYILFKQPTSTIETVKAHATFPHDEFPGDDRCDFWKNDVLGWQGVRKWPETSERSSEGFKLSQVWRDASLLPSLPEPSDETLLIRCVVLRERMYRIRLRMKLVLCSQRVSVMLQRGSTGEASV